jgi:arylsulfatase A-like enzyme
MKKYFPYLLAGMAIAGMALACSGNRTSPEGRQDTLPNIIYIISDDQSWTDYSFMGHAHIETPNIDLLAAEGLTFTRGYSTAPLCRPSLASMATGLYPHQHRVVGNDPLFEFDRGQTYGNEWQAARSVINQRVVEEFGKLQTLPDILREKGYLSLQTGKWWEGHFSNGGFTSGMTHGDPARGGRHGDEGLKIGREGLEPVFGFIESAVQEENPFFIWYAPFLPHAPHTPPDSLLEKYLPLAPSEPEAAYWAMCEWFDITCGQLMDFIEEKGLDENTLFIYVSDNGWIQDPDLPNRFAPRSKRSPYEMGIRSPIMFRWKGTIAPGMDTENPVSSIDIATTIIQLCGLSPTGQMQGINVLEPQQLADRKAIFAETYAHDFSSVDSSLYYRIILTRPWKLILPDGVNQPGALPELYNIGSDPHEQLNLAVSNPGLVTDLTDQIENWWE